MMKTTKFISTIFAMAIAGATFTSCLSNKEQDTIYRQTFGGLVTAVYSESAQEVSYSTSVAYVADYNYTKSTVDLSIGSLVLGGNSYTVLSFEDMPWSMNEDGWKNVTIINATPESSAATVFFDRMSFDISDRVNIDTQISYFPMTRINYTVNYGQYTVSSLMPMLVNTGTTYVSNQDMGDFQTTESIYIISLVKEANVDLNDATKRLASIRIKNAKFASGMPGMNMSFNNIPYEIGSDGKVHMSIDQLIPNIVVFNSNGLEVSSETPNESYPISNLTCVSDGANNMLLEFTCTVKGVDFKVSAVCKTPTKQQ